jgi:hypothetical protein
MAWPSAISCFVLLFLVLLFLPPPQVPLLRSAAPSAKASPGQISRIGWSEDGPPRRFGRRASSLPPPLLPPALPQPPFSSQTRPTRPKTPVRRGGFPSCRQRTGYHPRRRAHQGRKERAGWFVMTSSRVLMVSLTPDLVRKSLALSCRTVAGASCSRPSAGSLAPRIPNDRQFRPPRAKRPPAFSPPPPGNSGPP